MLSNEEHGSLSHIYLPGQGITEAEYSLSLALLIYFGTFIALLLGIGILMAHIQNHSRHISDSSLLVSCLRHSGVLPAALMNQARHSSLPASYTTSPVVEEGVLLAEANQEDCPAITLTAPPAGGYTAIGAEVILGKGKEKGHDANNAGLMVASMTRRRSFRSRGQGSQYGCLHEAVHIGAGVSLGLAGPEESEFGNAGIK